jgi:hypothetical protein
VGGNCFETVHGEPPKISVNDRCNVDGGMNGYGSRPDVTGAAAQCRMIDPTRMFHRLKRFLRSQSNQKVNHKRKVESGGNSERPVSKLWYAAGPPDLRFISRR